MVGPEMSEFRNSVEFQQKHRVNESISKPPNPLLLSSETERNLPLSVAYSIASQPYKKPIDSRDLQIEIEMSEPNEDPYKRGMGASAENNQK
mmetsp:Transcript_1885/g.2721  ORF Transcript_1885/g.2721 Transcript_1885/m.2721 type:complete len:92 (+) Transcript_1885:1852-2127(+)